MQILEQYNGSQMSFKPAIPPPTRDLLHTNKTKVTNNWAVGDFKNYCVAIEEKVDLRFKENVIWWRNKCIEIIVISFLFIKELKQLKKHIWYKLH